VFPTYVVYYYSTFAGKVNTFFIFTFSKVKRCVLKTGRLIFYSDLQTALILINQLKSVQKIKQKFRKFFFTFLLVISIRYRLQVGIFINNNGCNYCYCQKQ